MLIPLRKLLIFLAFVPVVVFARNEFVVVNETTQSINKIFISSSESDDWGKDLLGPNALPNGYQKDYTLGANGGCVYDIKVQYAQGWIEEKYKLNLCQLDRVVFNGDNAKRAQASSGSGSSGSSGSSRSGSASYDGSEPLRCGRNVNCSSQAEVVRKMRARWVNFSSNTHFSSACLDAIGRMRSMHPAAWGDGHPGWVQPQMDVCNMR